MDQLLVDVTDMEGVAPGDTATLIGRDGDAVLTAEEAAQAAGTITNELLSRLGPGWNGWCFLKKRASDASV